MAKPRRSSPVTIKHGFDYLPKEGFHGAKLDPPGALEYKKLWPHQKRFVKELENEPYGFIVGQPASGKTLAIAALLVRKLRAMPGFKAIIAVPQTIIGGGFEDNRFYLGREKIFFDPVMKLHNPTEATNNSQLKRFLKKKPTSPVNDRVLICTHQTLVAAYKKFPKLFRDVIVVVDEAHHSRAADDDSLSNRLGTTVTGLIEQGEHILLATATAARADGAGLTGSYKEEFVVSECPFDEYMKVCRWFRSFSFDFVLYQEELWKPVDQLLGDKRKCPPKTIIHIPNVHSGSSRGKYTDVASVYRGISGGRDLEVKNPQGRGDGITLVKRGRRWVRVVNLVSEQNRDVKKQTILAAHNDPDADRIDVIVALNMFKEGANWRWAQKSLVVGHRGSLPELAQMIGRGLRDAPEKYHTDLHYLLFTGVHTPISKKGTAILNDYVKSLLFVLLLEDIFKPTPIWTTEASTGKRRRIRSNLLLEAVKYDLIERLRIEAVVFGELVHHDEVPIYLVVEVLEREGVVHDWASLSTIAQQILKAHRRRSDSVLQRLRQDVERLGAKETSVELLQKGGHPLAYMLYYTSALGITTLQNLRVALRSQLDREWWEFYHLLLECVEEKGRLPAGQETFKNKPVAKWAQAQRAHYNQLSPRKRELLEQIPGWVWAVYESTWAQNYKDLELYIQKHQRLPQRNDTLGMWCQIQRNSNRRGTLRADRKELLEQLPGWLWDVKEERWQGTYQEVKQLLLSGKPLPPRQAGELSKSGDLGRWCQRQRSDYRKGKLSKERIELLEQLPGWVWDTKKHQWLLRYKLLCEFFKVHKRPPFQKEVFQEVNIGAWVSLQRNRYKKNTLQQDRIELLEQLPGWVWDTKDAVWEECFQLYRQFLSEFGRIPTANEKYQGHSIGGWGSTQRSNYYNHRLSIARAQRLEQLPGWVWDVEEHQWLLRYEKARAFREEENRWPSQGERYDGYAVGSWVSRQRTHYKKDLLSASQIELLEQLPGWVWDAQDSAWREKLDRASKLLKENGILPTREALSKEEARLSRWLEYNRLQHFHGKLSPERVRLLDSKLGKDYWQVQTTSTFPYASSRKQRARYSAVVRTYRGLFKQRRLPSNKQYWSMSAQCVHGNGTFMQLIPGTELAQLDQVKFLHHHHQFHGVDHDESVFEANCRYDGANWYYGDFYDVISEAADTDPDFNPGIVNVDTVSEPRLGVELFTKVLYRLRDVRDVLFVGNFIRRNRGRWHSTDELVETIRNNPKFRQVASTLEWNEETVFYTYYGATAGKRTIMTSVMMWRR